MYVSCTFKGHAASRATQTHYLIHQTLWITCSARPCTINLIISLTKTIAIHNQTKWLLQKWTKKWYIYVNQHYRHSWNNPNLYFCPETLEDLRELFCLPIGSNPVTLKWDRCVCKEKLPNVWLRQCSARIFLVICLKIKEGFRQSLSLHTSWTKPQHVLLVTINIFFLSCVMTGVKTLVQAILSKSALLIYKIHSYI